MKLRWKIANGVLGVLVLAILVLALLLRHNGGCVPRPVISDGADTMRAAIARCYGGPHVIEITDVDKPVPGAGDVLVRVRAAAVNPLDYHYLRGTPYVMRLSSGIGRPSDIRMGVDFAGVVEAVGSDVANFAPGDRVFGGRGGAFAEFVLIPADRAIARIPDGVEFEQAAALPIAAITALQALRDDGQLQAGEQVLINGASGGVGTYAVQIAKAMGAGVTGVCSTRNVEMVQNLGADRVIDYTQANYTEDDAAYDLIVDMVSNHSLRANRRVMTPGGRLVIVGTQKSNWLKPFMRPLAGMLYSPFVDESFEMILAELNQPDLQVLAEYLGSGALRSQIDRRYTLDELADAITYSESGRARGKIIITFD